MQILSVFSLSCGYYGHYCVMNSYHFLIPRLMKSLRGNLDKQRDLLKFAAFAALGLTSGYIKLRASVV